MVTENNVDLFQSIKDIVPVSPYELDNYFSEQAMPYSVLMNYLSNLTNLSTSELLTKYVFEYGERRLSNFSTKFIKLYGIQLYHSSTANIDVYIPNISAIGQSCQLIYDLYQDKWKRLAEDFKITYDPTKPLDLESKYVTSKDHMESTSGSSSSRNKSGSNTDNNETEYDNTDSKIYGFNSINGVNSDSVKNTSKDNSNGTFSSKDEYSNNDTYTRDSQSEKDITRKGNIGNRLQSEMLEKEIEFREKKLIDIITRDINSVLTRSKYI